MDIEHGRKMAMHSFIIGIILYGLMVVVMRQDPRVAENRSILIAALVLIYMIVFGHRLPTQLNPYL